MKAALEVDIARKDWKNAATVASNLSELYLTMGDIAQAIDYAKQSVELAGISDDAREQSVHRTTLAAALHNVGRLAEAESLFQKAEEIQEEYLPDDPPLLYSTAGFKYCDLLLSQGKYKEVLRRAEEALKIVLNGSRSLLDLALNHLSLGRAHLLQTLREGTGDLSQAAEHLNQAVDWLRRAGTQHELPRGLLARAELYIAQKDFDKARRDLDEAMTIAERGEMELYMADCRLGYARLYLAMGDKEKAWEELAAAKEMITKMGYHRRDGEVKEMEEQLKTT